MSIEAIREKMTELGRVRIRKMNADAILTKSAEKKFRVFFSIGVMLMLLVLLDMLTAIYTKIPVSIPLFGACVVLLLLAFLRSAIISYRLKRGYYTCKDMNDEEIQALVTKHGKK